MSASSVPRPKKPGASALPSARRASTSAPRRRRPARCRHKSAVFFTPPPVRGSRRPRRSRGRPSCRRIIRDYMSPISTGQSALACLRAALIASLAGVVAACAPALKHEARRSGGAPARRAPGAYYQDDGPGANPPDNLDAIPDAMPRLEPLHRFANRPYTVFGHDYVPATTLRSLPRARARVVVRPQVPCAKDGHRRDLRHVRDDGRASDPAAALVRAGHQPRQRQERRRAGQRSRAVSSRAASSTCRTPRRTGWALRKKAAAKSRSRASCPARRRRSSAAPLPPVAASEARAGDRALPIGQEAGGYVAQLGAFANYANAQEFVGRLANQTGTLGVEPKSPAGHGPVSRLCRTLSDEGGGTPGRRPAARCIGARLDGAHGTAGAVTR